MGNKTWCRFCNAPLWITAMNNNRYFFLTPIRAAVLLAISALASCASAQTRAPSEFSAQVKGEGDIELKGWLRLRGEVMLFSTREAMRSSLNYPDCISGVFSDHIAQDLSQFDGKRVIVTGKLYRYDTLDEEEVPILKRKVLSGSVIPNFCFGDNVLLIKHIEVAQHL
jgi:hypothetical protein